MADIKPSSEEQHENHNWDEHVIEDDDEHHVRPDENKQEAQVETPKEVYKKDKHGNILITSLGDYIEPTKIVKGAHAGDLASKSQYDAFKNATVYESDEEKEIKGYDGLDEILTSNKQNEKKLKNQKLKPKKGEDDGLDDLLKEFGIENVPKNEESKKKEQKPKVEKPKVEKIEKEEGNKKEEEKKKPEKEKKPEKKATAKSHINDAKKEILKKQEELKKKEKKKGM